MGRLDAGGGGHSKWHGAVRRARIEPGKPLRQVNSLTAVYVVMDTAQFRVSDILKETKPDPVILVNLMSTLGSHEVSKFLKY